MVLSDLLVALSGNTSLYVTLTDTTGSTLITFNAGGYANVESDLGAREVERITLISPSKITISLKDA